MMRQRRRRTGERGQKTIADWLDECRQRDDLVCQWKPLVTHLWKKLPRLPGVDEGAVLLAGYEALVRCSQRYRLGGPVQFQTFCYQAIRGAMMREMNTNGLIRTPAQPGGRSRRADCVEAARRARSPVSLHGVLANGSDADVPDPSSLPREVPVEWVRVRRAVRGLPRRMRVLVRLRFERGWTLADLATRFRLSKAAVQRRLRESLHRLRERYEGRAIR